MDVSDPEQLSVHYLNYSIDPPNQSNHRLPEKFLFFFHPSSSSSSFHFFVSFSFLLHPLSSSLSPLPLFSHIILITRTSPQPWRLLQTVLPDLHFFPGSRNKQIDTCFFFSCVDQIHLFLIFLRLHSLYLVCLVFLQCSSTPATYLDTPFPVLRPCILWPPTEKKEKKRKILFLCRDLKKDFCVSYL